VVAFRSAPADGDRQRSMIDTNRHTYALPPLATVTLERVQEAGQWRAFRKTLSCRLYTVSESASLTDAEPPRVSAENAWANIAIVFAPFSTVNLFISRQAMRGAG
jgi:hypothetical protein